MQQPSLITYNLKERGRRYTGNERNFNIKAICDAVNSPATQERIKMRAMVGYFGHKARVLVGLVPTESAIVGGKYNEIDPAIITTHLKAYPDGTIEHQTEFLDTEPGQRAARLHSQKIGGFSSAIDDRQNKFYGFDYVLDPNFVANRGFTFDSVAGLTFDSAMELPLPDEDAEWLALLEQRDRLITDLHAALDSAQAENEQYLSMLAVAGHTNGVALDSASGHLILTEKGADQLRHDIDVFRSAASLPRFVEKQDNQADSGYDLALGRVRV
jgi:hypothetical protein